MFFLTKAGLITAETMKLYRRHAFVVILIVGAIITPPDVISQVLISMPLMLLYEVSINISQSIRKRDLKKLNENNTI